MSLRPALLVAAALAAASGICLALGRWGGWDSGDLLAIVREVQRGEELDPSIEAARRRHEAKYDLAAALVAGRLSLREAADNYRLLEEAAPDYLPDVLPPSADERELCEHLLGWVWAVLAQDPRGAEEVLDRLEAEFRRSSLQSTIPSRGAASGSLPSLSSQGHRRPAPVPGGGGRPGS
jgi:hypothetical protein